MDRAALGAGQQIVVGGQDRAREVTRGIDHGGPCRAQQPVGHLTDDPVERVRQNRQQDRIEGGGHAATWSRWRWKLRCSSSRAAQPGGITTVVVDSSTIAGPVITWWGPRV